jgi:hypothetical protein
MVCDPCGGVKQCAPGCRTDADCGQPLTCQAGTTCFTCPCATHYCAIDPCIDNDHDGYVPGESSGCSSKPGGDCDDTRADVHPGAPEICNDGIDNNCNGLTDAEDPACSMQCTGSNPCQSNFDCSLGVSFCPPPSGGTVGCCEMCPIIAVDCIPGDVPVANGVDRQTGCPQTICVPDTICPQNYSPVCATNGATYSNDCEAMKANATIAHAGECLPGEGLGCNPGDPNSCGPSGNMYCRGGCPFCDSFDFACMQKGACVMDFDCPAGEPPPPMTCMVGQSVHVSCVNHACQYTCQ